MTEIDGKKLKEFTGKIVKDIAGAVSLLMSYIGDQAGVYSVIDEHGPISATQLADKTGLRERYLLEWLSANAAAGYVEYDANSDTFSMTPEQAIVLSRVGQPLFLQGFIQAVVAQYEGHEKAVHTFKTGEGRPWSEQSSCMFCATDRFFRPGYEANLFETWLPSLEGVVQKLTDGSKAADIGCGYGSTTILMAKTFPNSEFRGFDFHAPSIEAATAQAKQEGLTNVSFEVATAKDFPGKDYDFTCIFDALHDMGDPVGASRHIKETLSPDGTLMLVEPRAGDNITENMHVFGQIFYGFSTTACVPASIAQEVGLALGAQAGEKRLTQVLNEAGFQRVRRTCDTPTNIILEVKV